MTANSGDEEAPVLSIEDFAASIAASLAVSAQATPESESSVDAPVHVLPFRERVAKRSGSAQLLVFRVANELFGVELVTAEEALDMPTLHRLPEMPPSMLGVFTLRGALVSVFEPQLMLGIGCRQAATAVVFCGGDRRVAIATDDVDDVITVDLRTVREAPGGVTRTREGALLGIVHRDADLIALLDTAALIGLHGSPAGTRAEPTEETV
ncbi:MAG TPA: chemotaxis protein CheW [Gemmatimonadaceae bacterium]|jgi:purine-binding chemotaxis protein CheW